MGCVHFNGAIVCGNFRKVTKKKPKNWIETGYKIIVPYRFKWREKIGRVECDCKEVEEHFQPWYGTSWYHSHDCALMKHLHKRPQILNLRQFARTEIRLIARTE